jgi:uncharacterized protein (DUF58 family)
LKSIYLNLRFFALFTLPLGLYLVGFFVEPLYFLATPVLLGCVLLLGFDLSMVMLKKQGIKAARECPDRFSNGDDNKVILYLKNEYPFDLTVRVIDEIPIIFQERNFTFSLKLKANAEVSYHYSLRPTKRGEYEFNNINVFVLSPIRLLSRRYVINADFKVAVYPSFLQMRKYEMLAISNRLEQSGVKKIRKIGQSREFEKIKEYVQGDDYRQINWKATARKSRLMVNTFQDERSQEVYSVIDMGRAMKMPFEGMTLLDYAINSSLVLSNIALYKHDKAGIITFTEKTKSFLSASKRNLQMNRILELLYKQKTSYNESNYEDLYIQIKQHIKQHSLLMLYTNFESVSSLKRQLPYLRMIARSHLLVVIIFENTEVKKVIEEDAEKLSEIYVKTIAEQFVMEKNLIKKELIKYGINCITSSPENLTVNSINKYLELKSRGLI